VIFAESREAEVEAVASLVTRWCSDGCELLPGGGKISASEIGILYPRRQDRKLMERLYTKLAEFGIVRLSGREATGGFADKGIKVSTIHSAKGLQFRATLLMWADLLPSPFENRSDETERSLIYVALTRAEEVLVVTHSGPSAYVDEIKRNIEAARL
jgi:hypothetical protein